MKENEGNKKIKLTYIFAIIALLSLITVFVLGINLGKNIENYTFAKDNFEKMEKGDNAYSSTKTLIEIYKKQINFAIFNMIVPILLTITTFLLSISNIDKPYSSRDTSSIEKISEKVLIPCDSEPPDKNITTAATNGCASYQGNDVPPQPNMPYYAQKNNLARVRMISIPQDKLSSQDK